MTVGEALVALLAKYGVDTVFGIPGTHSIELYRGLEPGGIRHVLTRHEQGAGFMADGYARITGKPGVCFVITGAGVTNISTAVAQAYSDSVPLLILSPVNDPVVGTDGRREHHGRLHELGDQAAVTRPFTAFSETADSQSHLFDLIHRAFALFEHERPRPVHINIPLSMLRSEADGDLHIQRAQASPPVTADPILIDDMAARLQSARAVTIIAGGGCRHFGELVVALAEKIAAPVITTVAGRGVIPATHPLCPGMQLAAAPTHALLDDCDLLLVLGSELAETDHWTSGLSLPAAQIWINLDPNIPNSSHAGSDGDGVMSLQVDARSVLTQLCSMLDAASPERNRAAMSRLQPVRKQHGAGFNTAQRFQWRVLTELRKALPDDAIVCSDMTQLAYTAAEHLPLQVSNSWFHPNGYGTLGYALPAALGVRIGHRAAKVLALVGDAGLQYTQAEMMVATEHELPIVVLLWQNNALQQIADDMTAAGIGLQSVHQLNPDFIALAEVCGWQAQRVAGIAQLGPALEAAFAASRPCLLEFDAAR